MFSNYQRYFWAKVSRVLGCLLLASPIAATRLHADEPRTADPAPASAASVGDWKLLEPFWNSRVVHRESVLFVHEPDAEYATARLLLPVEEILEVTRADGSATYTAGTDYVVDREQGTLELTDGSAIPFLEADALFPPVDAARTIPHKQGDPKRGILFDNEHWFHDQQLEITYRAAADWSGFRPKFAGEQLPKTMAKLRAGEPLTIGLSGDSISFGLNASGLTGAAPHMPIYPQLVAEQLHQSFGSEIKLVNRAVGGWRVEHGLEDLPKLLESQPDLVIVAYGMNHVGSRDAEKFRQLLGELVAGIQAASADTEIILVAPMIGNGQWIHTPREQFEPHRDAIASFVGPGVALADLTTLWGEMLARKRDGDLTGNGVNHPNDFGHRVYAQAILALLIEQSATHDFPQPINTEKATTSPMPPEEVVRTAKLPPGFQLEVFAAEPDVQNPIAITTDERGRLWVAENYTWSGASFGNYDTSLRDRIVILADKDGDGRHDQRTVFWDEGRKVTSVEVGYGGVWVLALPNLLFIPDANRDDAPDGPPQVVLDGLDEQAVGHTPANGLKWGPDGWLYARHGIQATSRIGPPGASESQRVAINTGVWRYHPTRGTVEAVMHGMTNSWGFDYDARGEMFVINTVIGHLWHLVPGTHVERMYGIDLNPHVYTLIEQAADHVHWDTGEKWNDVRFGVTDKTDAAGGGHAHIGLMIYQGDNWPAEYRGRVYTLNLHGQRINCDILEPTGAGFTATHGPDLCFISDPWYRGMDLITGADGGVFIADWSDTGECHDHDGVHRTSGRIYKLTYGQPAPLAEFDLAHLDSAAQCEKFAAPNAWWGRQVLQLWRQRAAADEDLSAVNEWLISRLRSTDTAAEQRVQTLWGLAATGGLSESLLLHMLEDSDAAVRGWAVRLLIDPCTPGGDQPSAAVYNVFVRHAQSDQAGLVSLYLASALQKLAVDSRWTLAEALASRSDWAHDRVLPHLVWYGIEPVVPRDRDVALKLVASSPIGLLRKHVARRLTVDLESQPDTVAALLALAVEDPTGERASDIVLGMADALRGWRQAPAPANWSAISDQIAKNPAAETQSALQELNVVFGDGRALDELRRVMVDAGADPSERQQALRALLVGRPDDLAPTLHNLLGDRAVLTEALRGLALYDHADTPSQVLGHIGLYTPEARAEMINTLVSRPQFARALLSAVANGTVASSEVSAFHARQIRSFDDEELNRQLTEVWGDVRVTAAEKRTLIEEWRSRLTSEALASADAHAGRSLFNKSCANCHVLYGVGRKLGPDLTGSNRKNLDYLLENVIDPSASVGTDFRAVNAVLEDGRVISGVVSEQSERTLTLQTAQESITLDRQEIEELVATNNSMMPDGLLLNLSPDEVRDLVAYLMSSDQVPLASE